MRHLLGFAKQILGGIMSGSPKMIPVKIPVLQTNLLQGRTALITGASRGIGRVIAEAFSAAGARVLIAGRNRKTVDMVAKELSNKGRTALGVELDITDISSVGKTLSNLPSFDILVNNAGFIGGDGFGKTLENDYDLVLNTNLKGSYFLSQAVSQKWIAENVKGNILNVCSASSLRPGNSPYILSKWGLRSLTIGMAKQLIKHGIVVNGIAPGVTDTDQFTHGTDDIGKASNPSGRMVTRDEIANMSVILVSSLCRMVVGDILYMTGGGGIVTLED